MLRALQLTLLLSIASGCGASQVYDMPPSKPAGPPKPQVGEKLVSLKAKDISQLRLFNGNFSLSSVAHRRTFPAIRFDLTPVPQGVTVKRAVLRLRRGGVHYSDEANPPRTILLQLMNVNRGLHIKGAAIKDRVGTITDAQETSNEGDMWVRLSGPYGDQRAGIDLYNFICESKYLGLSNKMYLEFLQQNNQSIPTSIAGAQMSDPWDELDITSFVAAECRGDRSITLLITSTQEIMVGWYDNNPQTKYGMLSNNADLHPQLVVEYDDGSATPASPPKLATSGKLLITSTPVGAKIRLDNELVGTTVEGKAAEVPVASERVKVRLELDGYEAWEESLKVIEGAVIPVHAELKKKGS